MRHFLYLNVELVGAFLEQLEGGKVQVTESVSESRKHLQGGINIPLLQFGARGERLTGHRETKTIYYYLYNRLETALRNEGKLIDSLDLGKVGENQFFLGNGIVTFTPRWSDWNSLKYIFSKLNEWGRQQQRLLSEQQVQTTPPYQEITNVTRNLASSDNRPIIPLTQNSALPMLPDEPPEEIRPLIKPEAIDIILGVPEMHRKFVGSAFLEHFTGDCISELTRGEMTRKAFAMGLTGELSENWIRFTPMAIFVVI